MKSVVRIGANGKGRRRDLDQAIPGDRLQIDARAELIQALIPIGLEAVNELLLADWIRLLMASSNPLLIREVNHRSTPAQCFLIAWPP